MEIKRISFAKIPTKAIEYWKKTIGYQIAFSLCFFTIYVGLNMFLYQNFGILEQITSISEYLVNDTERFMSDYSEIVSSEEFESVVLYMILVSAILFPLNIGFFNIYRKLDISEKISLRDLFIGYEGNNFFKFLGYSLFWGGIYHICKINPIFMILWILITLLVAPLLFLENKKIFEALKLSFKAFRLNILNFLLILILSVFGSYLGFLLFGIGIILTFPFWNAVLYVLYKEVFT